MKYLSLDIETTGLDPEKDQVIMLSAIVEDTENLKPLKDLPHFTCFIEHDRYEGNAYALAMNSWIFEALTSKAKPKYPIFKMREAMGTLASFCLKEFGGKSPVLAGKNVAGFDWQFLKRQTAMRVKHRMIDPGNIFIDWKKDVPPDLQGCMDIAGVKGEVTHDAYDDALDVIKVLRTRYS